MPKHRRKLPSELTKPLKPLAFGLLADDDYKRQALAERSRVIVRRLELLRMFYRIKPGPDAGLLLALLIDQDHARGAPPKRMTAQYVAKQFGRIESLRIACGIPAGPMAGWLVAFRLAQQHFRGFQEHHPRGRPDAWTHFELAMLAGEVRRELENGAPSVAEACRRLSKLPPWETWLRRRRWGSGAYRRSRTPRGPWDALRKAYRAMKKHHRIVGEKAYQYQMLTNTPEGWNAYVEQIAQAPPGDE